jgi:hypothetical protein
VALGACGQPARFDPTQLGSGAVVVRRAGIVLASGPVGSGSFAGRGTWALVDVANPLSVDVLATLEGDLLDAGGRPVGRLNRDSLRVPAGAQRTFALVHHAGEVPAATGADVRVHSVQLARHPPTVSMRDAHVYRDGDRVVVAANLTNDLERETIAVVIAGFYDGDGRILQRPHTLLRIPGGVTHPARFVGPDGSRSGYLFLGEQIY